jgi:hypothetical protein
VFYLINVVAYDKLIIRGQAHQMFDDGVVTGVSLRHLTKQVLRQCEMGAAELSEFFSSLRANVRVLFLNCNVKHAGEAIDRYLRIPFMDICHRYKSERD